MKILLLPIFTIVSLCGLLKAEESGKHLFILSGQSNMAPVQTSVMVYPGNQRGIGRRQCHREFPPKADNRFPNGTRNGKAAKERPILAQERYTIP